MIMGMMAGQMRVAGSAPPHPVSLVGVAATSNSFSGTSFVVTVPGGASSGDTLVAVLRCRADRSFSTPPEWTLRHSIIVGTSPTSSFNTRLYVMYKAYASESTATFIQSVSAAGVAVVAVVRGTLGTGATITGNTISFAPVNAASMLLAVGTTNNTTEPAASWSAPFVTAGTYKWSASSPYFYGASLSTYISGATSLETAAYTWTFHVDSPNSNYSVLIEILPLT